MLWQPFPQCRRGIHPLFNIYSYFTKETIELRPNATRMRTKLLQYCNAVCNARTRSLQGAEAIRSVNQCSQTCSYIFFALPPRATGNCSRLSERLSGQTQQRIDLHVNKPLSSANSALKESDRTAQPTEDTNWIKIFFS